MQYTVEDFFARFAQRVKFPAFHSTYHQYSISSSLGQHISDLPWYLIPKWSKIHRVYIEKSVLFLECCIHKRIAFSNKKGKLTLKYYFDNSNKQRIISILLCRSAITAKGLKAPLVYRILGKKKTWWKFTWHVRTITVYFQEKGTKLEWRWI